MRNSQRDDIDRLRGKRTSSAPPMAVDRLLHGDGSEVPLSLRVIRLFEKDSVVVCPPLRGRGNQVPALSLRISQHGS